MLYALAAAGHMTLLQLNLKRGHKFIPSGVMFGYCMARITTLILRITWANYPTNARLAIAANIFVAAGVLLLYILNLLFSQRIIRATHPTWGWSKPFGLAFKALYVMIPFVLIMVITVTVQMAYTLNSRTQGIDSKIRIGAQCFLMAVAFLPLPLLTVNFLLPRPKERGIDHFGRGKWALKATLIIIATLLLTLGAGFRVGVAFQDLYHPRQRTDPGWYHSKACFWVFDFVVELVVVWMYLVARVDLRFHVPNGSSKRRNYKFHVEAPMVGEKGAMGKQGEEKDVMDEEVVVESPASERPAVGEGGDWDRPVERPTGSVGFNHG